MILVLYISLTCSLISSSTILSFTKSIWSVEIYNASRFSRLMDNTSALALLNRNSCSRVSFKREARSS